MGCHKCLLYTRILIYMATIFIHGANITVMLNSFTEEAMRKEEVRNLYRIKYYFFTTWNFTFQILYAAFAAYCDLKTVRNTSEKKIAPSESITNLRENIFTTVIWPSTLLVTTYFWSFYAYDRNLLYPDYFDIVVPDTSNQIMHTMILAVVLLEVLLYPKKKPDNLVVGVCCVLLLQAVYVCVLFFVYKTTGIWMYPIFGYLYQTIYLPIFLGITALYLMVIYYSQFCIGNYLVLKLWKKIGEKYCTGCRK